jgi:hypothetical protein
MARKRSRTGAMLMEERSLSLAGQAPFRREIDEDRVTGFAGGIDGITGP